VVTFFAEALVIELERNELVPNRAEDSARAAPSLMAIFLAFLRLGCTSFGGGTAGWLHRDIVLKRRWLDDPTFLAMLTVGQALPGSNGTKLTVLIGQHLRGTAGAAIAAAVVGLTFATGLRSVVHGAPEPIAWAIAALTVLCVGVLRWPLIPVVLCLAPLSIGLAWVQLMRR
jgi:chromate transporter